MIWISSEKQRRDRAVFTSRGSTLAIKLNLGVRKQKLTINYKLQIVNCRIKPEPNSHSTSVAILHCEVQNIGIITTVVVESKSSRKATTSSYSHNFNQHKWLCFIYIVLHQCCHEPMWQNEKFAIREPNRFVDSIRFDSWIRWSIHENSWLSKYQTKDCKRISNSMEKTKKCLLVCERSSYVQRYMCGFFLVGLLEFWLH